MTVRCHHIRFGVCSACQADWEDRDPYAWVDPDQRREAVVSRVEKSQREYASQQAMIDRSVDAAFQRNNPNYDWNRP